MIDATNAAGGRMFGQTHSRGVTTVTSFKTTTMLDDFPEWKAVRALALDGQRHAFTDPHVRQRLIEAAPELSASTNPFGLRSTSYEGLYVLTSPTGTNRTVAELARERGVHPAEVMMDLALASDFDQCFMRYMEPVPRDELLATMRRPGEVMTFSDSGAHVSQIMDCALQTYFLGHWSREQQEFTLEEAVRMITSVPAAAWGLTDRGLVREGYRADLLVFDPDRIGPDLPRVVHDLPLGEKRLFTGSTGMRATIVDGQVVIADGEHTGALPGALLRRRRATH
jgi:N-acyl-D-aspartate/D-glutamate deacylase